MSNKGASARTLSGKMGDGPVGPLSGDAGGGEREEGERGRGRGRGGERRPVRLALQLPYSLLERGGGADTRSATLRGSASTLWERRKRSASTFRVRRSPLAVSWLTPAISR